MVMMVMMGEEEGRLDTEDHPTQQQTTKYNFPGSDPDAERQPGQQDSPQRLREHDGEGVTQRHEEDTGELE